MTPTNVGLFLFFMLVVVPCLYWAGRFAITALKLAYALAMAFIGDAGRAWRGDRY